MDSTIVKKGLDMLLKYIPVELPPMGWYFSDAQPEDAIAHGYDERSCIFNHLQSIADGKKLCLSAHHSGCMAGNCYLGFDEPANVKDRIIAAVTVREKFKKTTELGKALYQNVRVTPAKKEYLILEQLADIQDGTDIEVVVFWVNGLAIAGLTTLANYDKESNDNVLIPFCSGCQGVWTLPYLEKEKAIVGCIDPSLRWKIPSNVLSFSMSSKRFVEMAENASESFLTEKFWDKALNS